MVGKGDWKSKQDNWVVSFGSEEAATPEDAIIQFFFLSSVKYRNIFPEPAGPFVKIQFDLDC